MRRLDEKILSRSRTDVHKLTPSTAIKTSFNAPATVEQLASVLLTAGDVQLLMTRSHYSELS